MANTKVALQLRIRLSDGKRVYAAPAFTSNGKLKPRTALVNGNAGHRPESVYVLRYREDGRLIYRQVGNDPSAAQAARIRQELLLKSKAAGIALAEPEHRPAGISKRVLSECIATYLAETKEHKADKTFAAYKETLDLFVEAVSACTISPLI